MFKNPLERSLVLKRDGGGLLMGNIMDDGTPDWSEVSNTVIITSG